MTQKSIYDFSEVTLVCEDSECDSAHRVILTLTINMAPKNIKFDLTECKHLLDESRELEDEGFKHHEESSWHSKFSESIKSGVGSLETFGETVKQKLTTMKVRLSLSRDEEFVVGDDIKSGEIKDKVHDNDQLLFATNLVMKVTRRVQKVTSSHGIALDFLQELINRLEARLKKVEKDTDVDKGWVEAEVADKVAPVDEKVVKLEKKAASLEMEIDETRQRGMKGNLILSTRFATKDLLNPVRVTGNMETPSQMCKRLIQKKTGVDLPIADILACHSVGKSSYIVKVLNWKKHSAWESICAAMATGKHENGNLMVNNDLFLSFQLTSRRQVLLRNVVKARKEKYIKNYKVNQNGRIFTAKAGDSPAERMPWVEVKDMDDLSTVCDGTQMPLVEER